MFRNALILFALALIVALPFALRPRGSLLAAADETLVIVSPHNEAIRAEFARGFRDWYHTKTGKTARIDWRIPGGTSEIARYLAGEYQAPFENYWRHTLGRRWTDAVQRAFDDPKIQPGPDVGNDTEPETARRAFLHSNVGIGIDLFFGGGSFDFIQQAAAGRLVDSGFVRSHPELFGDEATQIPQTLSGEPFWDKDGRWFGNVLSAFGICYNVESVSRVRLREGGFSPRLTAPTTLMPTMSKSWRALADPVFAKLIALADPNQSGSVAKAFEMIIQQSINDAIRSTLHDDDGVPREDSEEAWQRYLGQRNERKKLEGWDEAMRLIEKMSANARYFTDSATKIPIDVADGDAAAGMCIDFYGRFESENARNADADHRERMMFFTPPGGTSYGVDPIALLRGAPHRTLALAFMEYVMSLDGQKLWNWKIGTPGGPQQYALRRLPIRRELYAPEFAEFRADPDVYPYEEAKNFTYHPEWTAHLFNPIRFIVRVMCVDPHEEAREAWAALIQARFPDEAMKVFGDLSAVSYEEANGRIRETLRNPDKLAEARLAAELTAKFRAQYRRAAELARAGK